MGEKTTKEQEQEQEKKDVAEFGVVTDVEQLAPDAQVAPSMQRDMQQRVTDPTKSAYFEGHASGAASGLTIQESETDKLSIWKDRTQDEYGVDLKRFQAGYNAYLIPYRETLRSEGRVKDLSIAGAALTPAELQRANPEIAKRLQSTNSSNGAQEVAFNAWSTQEKTTVSEIRQFGALQHSMVSALKSFDRIKDKLAERRVTARQDAATAELKKIEATADTLASITKVTWDGLGILSEVEVTMAAQAPFNENAEGIGDLSHIPQSGRTDYGHGTGEDPTSAQRQLGKTAGQKGGDAASTAADHAERAMKIATFVHSQLAKGDDLDLSLRSVFIAADGDATKYKKLQDQITLLGTNLNDLKMSEEAADIASVEANLTATTMSYSATKKAVQQDKSLSRRDAKAYSDVMNGGTPGTLAMYSAEAFQELATFGRLAETQRKQMVDPQARAIRHWLSNTDVHRFEANTHELRDARSVASTVKDVGEQRQHLEQHLPDWEKTAADWSNFFSMPLIPGTK